MLTITSPQNQKIKDLAKLRESRQRRRTAQFILEGARELERALARGFELKSLFFCPELLSGDAQGLLSRIDDLLKIQITVEVFEKVAVRAGSDGVIAILAEKRWAWSDLSQLQKPFLLVLENIEKPGNFGALARSADGAGVDAIVVLDPAADLYNPHAIRASVGALFSRPIIACDHWTLTTYCQEQAIRIVTASPFAEQFHWQADLRGPIALVLGSEAWGLSAHWQKLEHVPVKIPMLGMADSLNVSVAGAVVLYEILRQRMQSIKD